MILISIANGNGHKFSLVGDISFYELKFETVIVCVTCPDRITERSSKLLGATREALFHWRIFSLPGRSPPFLSGRPVAPGKLCDDGVVYVV